MIYDPSVPATTGLSPDHKTAGDPAFVSGSVVRWNGSDRTATYVSATQRTASIPASDISSPGTASVTVFTPAPGGGTSNAGTFTITPAPVPAASTWYLAEGSSAWGFECWLLIQNPNGSEATCTITYMIEEEGPQTVTEQVPANSRKTYNMADDIGSKDASIKVDSNIPVIPERAMYWSTRGSGTDTIGGFSD